MFKPKPIVCITVIMLVSLGFFTVPAFSETRIKLGHFGPGPDPFSKSVEIFAKHIAENSGGRLKVEIFPAGQLGNEKQQLSALQGGLQEMLITSSTNMTNMNEKLKLIDLPFVFASYAEADAVTTGPLAEKMMAGLDRNNLVPLALWENGFRCISNSKRPIHTLADFKGLKIRVIGAPVFIDTFSALGTQPVPMPFPELYSAMETGTVDGQDNPALAIQALKFYEVQKYYTATNHIYGAMIVLAGKPFFKRLSQEDRDMLIAVAKDFGVEQRKLLRDADQSAMDFLSSKGGMEVIRSIDPEEIEKIRTAVKPVVQKSVTDSIQPLYQEMLGTIKSASK